MVVGKASPLNTCFLL